MSDSLKQNIHNDNAFEVLMSLYISSYCISGELTLRVEANEVAVSGPAFLGPPRKEEKKKKIEF